MFTRSIRKCNKSMQRTQQLTHVAEAAAFLKGSKPKSVSFPQPHAAVFADYVASARALIDAGHQLHNPKCRKHRAPHLSTLHSQIPSLHNTFMHTAHLILSFPQPCTSPPPPPPPPLPPMAPLLLTSKRNFKQPNLYTHTCNKPLLPSYPCRVTTLMPLPLLITSNSWTTAAHSPLRALERSSS